MHYEVGTWTEIFPMFLNRRKRRHNFKGTKLNRFITNPKQGVNPEFWSGSTDPFGRRRRWNQRIWSRGFNQHRRGRLHNMTAGRRGIKWRWSRKRKRRRWRHGCSLRWYWSLYCAWTGSGTWTRTAAWEAAGAKTLDESSTSILVTVAFNLVTEEFWQEEAITELILTEEHHEY